MTSLILQKREHVLIVQAYRGETRPKLARFQTQAQIHWRLTDSTTLEYRHIVTVRRPQPLQSCRERTPLVALFPHRLIFGPMPPFRPSPRLYSYGPRS